MMQTILLQPHDLVAFKALIAIFKEVFEHEDDHIVSDAHLLSLLHQLHFKVFTLQENGLVYGGLTLYVLQQYYHEQPLAYWYDVGVSTAHQRKGLGQQLIADVLQWCAAQGIEAAFVQAEADDAHALGFYEKTPFSEKLGAVQFEYAPVRRSKL